MITCSLTTLTWNQSQDIFCMWGRENLKPLQHLSVYYPVITYQREVGRKKNATWVTIETKPWPFKNCHGQSWWCAMSEKHNSGHWEANSVRGWMNEEVYPRTLEHRGGPGSTCDDIWHQAFVDALHKRDGGWLGQRVVWIGPRGRGRRPRLFSGHHLIYPVQRDWRQQLTYKQLTSLRAPGAAHSCRNRLIQMYKMDGSFRPCSDLRVA